MPESVDSDALRQQILDDFDMSLGAGLAKLSGKVFCIDHLGCFNDLMLAETLCGIEMGAGIDYRPEGAQAALDYLTETKQFPTTREQWPRLLFHDTTQDSEM